MMEGLKRTPNRTHHASTQHRTGNSRQHVDHGATAFSHGRRHGGRPLRYWLVRRQRADYRYQVFNADGGVRGFEQQITAEASNTIENRIELAGLLTNELAVVYQDTANSGTIIYSRMQPSSNGYFSTTVNDKTASDGTVSQGSNQHPFVIVEANGELVVGFSGVNGGLDPLFAQFGPHEFEGGFGLTAPGDQIQVEAAADDDAFIDFVLVFHDVPTGNVMIAVASFGSEFPVTVAPGSHPHVARLADGGFAVTWNNAGQVLTMIYDVDASTSNVIPRTAR